MHVFNMKMSGTLNEWVGFHWGVLETLSGLVDLGDISDGWSSILGALGVMHSLLWCFW
jgi:hypothetical protein